MAEPRPLVLASTSPYRRRMLEAAGLAFSVVAPGFDESALKTNLAKEKSTAPAGVAEALARAKALAASRQAPGALVIGADQVLALGDEMLDKPGSLAGAREQLLRLRGRTHRLISAAALAEEGRVVWTGSDQATLTMRTFSDRFLESYLVDAGARVTGIVGAYEIEGPGIQLFERIDGDFFTIVGLPLLALLAELRARGAIAP